MPSSLCLIFALLLRAVSGAPLNYDFGSLGRLEEEAAAAEAGLGCSGTGGPCLGELCGPERPCGALNSYCFGDGEEGVCACLPGYEQGLNGGCAIGGEGRRRMGQRHKSLLPFRLTETLEALPASLAQQLPAATTTTTGLPFNESGGLNDEPLTIRLDIQSLTKTLNSSLPSQLVECSTETRRVLQLLTELMRNQLPSNQPFRFQLF